jgi:hypothetical protein
VYLESIKVQMAKLHRTNQTSSLREGHVKWKKDKNDKEKG